MKTPPSTTDILYTSLLRRDYADYSNIFRFLLRGSLILVAAVLVLLLVSYFVVGNTHTLGRIVASSIAVVYLLVTGFLGKAGYRRHAAILLVLFYALLSMLTLYVWGVNTPFGIILLSITIVISGFLMGPRATVMIGGGLITFLLALQYCISYRGYSPVFSESLKQSHMGDGIAYAFGIAILVLISWLYSRKTEQLLFEARSAQAALARQKQLLEVRVKERTAELEKIQLEESRALYQFVEVGQLSAVLIHDLANHLTALTMDIEEMKRGQHSRVIERAQKSLGSLEQLVARYRDKLHGTEKPQPFDVAALVHETIRNQARTRAASIDVDVADNAKRARITGDPLRFTQVLTVLLNNALDATNGPADVKVVIRYNKKTHTLLVEVKDMGKGIPAVHRKQLFKPVQSSKKDGLGIGLFIARKIVETHFRGSLTCTRTANPTTFTMIFPQDHA